VGDAGYYRRACRLPQASDAHRELTGNSKNVWGIDDDALEQVLAMI
jgi:hypothetical protein